MVELTQLGRGIIGAVERLVYTDRVRWDGSKVPRLQGLKNIFNPARPAKAIIRDSSDLAQNVLESESLKRTSATLVVGTTLTFSSPGSNADPTNQQPVSYVTKDPKFMTDSDQVLLARALYGEARSCHPDEMRFIGYTILNRATNDKKWDGTDLRTAILARKQYSCFNPSDPNLKKLMAPEESDPAWQKAINTAGLLLVTGVPLEFKGMDHYHTVSTSPYWKNDPRLSRIGQLSLSDGSNTKHVFYKSN